MVSHRHAALFFLGRPLSPLYSTVMKVRAQLYKRNMLRRCRIDVPVISVGNLTMGGSGKTPMVLYLAEFLKARGFKPAVVSRGYHGKAKDTVNIVSDGFEVLMGPELAGDEPVMMANRLEGVVVAAGKKRSRVCQDITRTFHCDVIILDDGFQHLGMVRDLDLVLFDVTHFAGNSRVFPGGELREPISALKRCDAFVITGVIEDCLERAEKCRELLFKRFPEKQVFFSSPAYSSFHRYHIAADSIEKSVVAHTDFPDKLFGFSGIAQPDRFYQMITQYGLGPEDRKIFADHHVYSSNDIQELVRQAAEIGAQGFLTTEKDIVRLSTKHHSPLPFYVPLLEIRQNEQLESFIISHLS